MERAEGSLRWRDLGVRLSPWHWGRWMGARFHDRRTWPGVVIRPVLSKGFSVLVLVVVGLLLASVGRSDSGAVQLLVVVGLLLGVLLSLRWSVCRVEIHDGNVLVVSMFRKRRFAQSEVGSVEGRTRWPFVIPTITVERGSRVMLWAFGGLLWAPSWHRTVQQLGSGLLSSR